MSLSRILNDDPPPARNSGSVARTSSSPHQSQLSPSTARHGSAYDDSVNAPPEGVVTGGGLVGSGASRHVGSSPHYQVRSRLCLFFLQRRVVRMADKFHPLSPNLCRCESIAGSMHENVDVRHY